MRTQAVAVIIQTLHCLPIDKVATPLAVRAAAKGEN